jgi:adenylyltransferase/sulfurtransferase
MNAPTLKQWLDHSQYVVLIDVREPVEFTIESIPGAVSHPLSIFDPSKINLLREQRLLLYCQSGMRSDRAASQLISMGFTNVTQLQGGLSAWKVAAYPLTKSQNPPLICFVKCR